MFEKYGMSEVLGVHLLHRHEPLSDGEIKLEAKLDTVHNGKWSRPTPIAGLDMSDIHAVTFRFVAGDIVLLPYEFAKGPSPDIEIKDSCIEAVLNYVTDHQLFDQVALQILDSVKDGQPRAYTAEIEVGKLNGTVTLPVDMVKNPSLLPTGWSGNTQKPNDPEPQPGPNESWQKQVVRDKETHRVFISQARDEEELLAELTEHGVI